jgi:hypothetical protein
MHRRLAALLATPVLLLAACGSSGESSTADTDAGEGGSTTTAPVVDAAADQAAAEEAIDALEEVLAGKGLVAQADDEDDDEDDGDDMEFVSESCRRFDEAFPEDDELEGETANAEMATHERDAGMSFESVEASVGMTESAEDLDELMALLTDEEMADCLAEAMQLGVEGDQGGTDAPEFVVEGLEVSAGEVDDLGDENVRFEVGLTMVGSGLELPMTFEMLMVRDGRVAVMVMVGVGGMGEEEPSIGAEAAAQVLLDELAA